MRFFNFLILSLLLTASTAFANGSIDRFSPTLPLCGGSPADIYLNAGTGGCDVGGGTVLDTLDANYGLTGNDNNNGHSNDEVDPSLNHLIIFSVDGASAEIPSEDASETAGQVLEDSNSEGPDDPQEEPINEIASMKAATINPTSSSL